MAEYLGVFVEGGWIAGLVFKKYHCSLEEAVEDELKFDAAKVLADVNEGIEHMHKLGFAHVSFSKTLVPLSHFSVHWRRCFLPVKLLADDPLLPSHYQNDLNASNIMFTDSSLSHVVLIDFDSARPLGYKFVKNDKTGTHGWMLADSLDLSKEENDEFGLGALERYLKDPKKFEE